MNQLKRQNDIFIEQPKMDICVVDDVSDEVERFGSNRSTTETIISKQTNSYEIEFLKYIEDDLDNDSEYASDRRRSSILTLEDIDQWIHPYVEQNDSTRSLNRNLTYSPNLIQSKQHLSPNLEVKNNIKNERSSPSRTLSEHKHAVDKNLKQKKQKQKKGLTSPTSSVTLEEDEAEGEGGEVRRISMLAEARDIELHHYKRTIVQYINILLENPIYFAVSMILTVWAMINIDIRDIYLPKSSDDTLAWISFVVFIFFFIEMILLVLANPKTYRFQFYFWMDLLATLSMIPEFLPLFGVNTTSMSALTLARVGRVARAAARTARFARIVRFFELITRSRRTKEKNTWVDTNDKNSVNMIDDNISQSNKSDESEVQMIEPSQIRIHVNDLTFQTIFTVVLILFLGFTFVEPLIFEADFVYSHPDIELGIVQLLYLQTPVGTNSAFQAAFVHLKEQYGTRLLKLVITDDINQAAFLIENAARLNQLRNHEKFLSECGITNHCEAIFDIKPEAIKAAQLSIVVTVIIVSTLIATYIVLANRLQKWVISPIERMVAVVKTLATNPLATLNIKHDFRYETGLVEAMLRKISILLQIGFGAAGATIIRYNLSLSGDVKPIVKGNKVLAIFGFCDIRGFTSATEILQEDVMLFVNHIAKVVHEAVAQTGGFPNHNVGDAFLLVWPVPANHTPKDLNRIAQNSIRACQYILEALKRSDIIKQFQRRLSSESPREIKMGFGLHYGWAIVGAIGSRRKLDASYLSPHVNLSARLETATKQFGVDILFSETIYNMLLPTERHRCFTVDRCVLKGVADPLRLYTVDSGSSMNAMYKYQDIWETIIELYIQGKWFQAKPLITELQINVNNKFLPLILLLSYMKRYTFLPPKEWDGYRILDSK